MAHPYYNYNYYYPYPVQLQPNKTNYYNYNMIPQNTCPTYQQPPPCFNYPYPHPYPHPYSHPYSPCSYMQHPHEQHPYYHYDNPYIDELETNHDHDNLHHQHNHDDYDPQHKDDEFAPPDYDKDLYRIPGEDNETVEREDCDSIPIFNDIHKPKIKKLNHRHEVSDDDDDDYHDDDDDNSTICSDEDISIKSNANVSKDSKQNEDVFNLRIPRLPNKNFNIRMNPYCDNKDNRSICSNENKSIKSNSNVS